jgi:hypothetical protein
MPRILEFIKVNDKLYGIFKRIAIHNFLDKNSKLNSSFILEYKQYLNADGVLSTQTHYLFCVEIQELEWEVIRENN